MIKPLFSLILFSFFIQSSFAQNPVRKVNIDIASFQQQLAGAKHESVLGIGNAKNSETIISLPLPEGSAAKFKVIEYSILPSGTNTSAKTYLGEQIDKASVGCRITLTKEKMIATIYLNGHIIVIERDTLSTLSNAYNSYIQTNEAFQCGINNTIIQNGRIKDAAATLNFSNGTSLRTYRMAILVTNEFYIERGNTDVAINNEITAIINSMNGLFEKEIAVRFTLTSPINPVSSNVFYRKTEATSSYELNVNNIGQNIITRYGSANLDIGHILHTTGGGKAYLGSVCDNSLKGGGWSGSTTPTSFLVFAHEVGHQFSAHHTFNGNGDVNCSISNRNTESAYEPGSGTTIMSYAGLCISTQNITGGQQSYFHTNSLDKMINFIQTGPGNTCGTASATGNTAPVVNAGSNYTIPKNTPFTLTGSATDANGDALTYTWEEYDQPVAADSGKLGHTNNAVLSTTAPLFRSRQSLSPIRTFPDIAFVLNNNNNPPDTEGEDLPDIARTMVFHLTARDNKAGGGGVGMSFVTITVDGSTGPLAVTSPNGAESWAAGTLKNFTWDVNSTNTLSPNVKILLSVDGGANYPYTLASATPNTGTASIIIPSNVPNTNQARIKIVSTNGVSAEFFDMSNADFIITSSCLVANTFICPDDPVSASSGSPSLNLGLTKISGAKLINNSKNISFSNPTSTQFYSHTNENIEGCIAPSRWIMPAKIIAFRVSRTGSYEINVVPDNANDNGFSLFNSSSTFNCTTFIGSNTFFSEPDVMWYASRKFTLNSCTTYYAVVYNFSNASEFTINFSGEGFVFEIIPDTAGFSYSYVAVNQSNNQIEAISSTSDFTSISGGSFLVYGVSYDNGFNTNTLMNKTISETYALGTCLYFSSNAKPLTIISLPCSSNLVLTNPTDNISSGTMLRQASATNGKITASNFVTGSGTKATYQAKAIELNAGFKAETGTIFRAETGGCN